MTESCFDTLIFGGGGIYGVAFLGAISELCARNILCLKKIKNFMGVSIGSIICVALAIGYTVPELMDFFSNKSINKMYTDGISSIFRRIINLYYYKGFSRATYLKNLYCDLLNNKLNKVGLDHNCTLGQLKEKLGSINIYLIASNLETGCEKIFSTDPKHNTLEVKVIDAMFLSSCVPIVFSPIILSSNPASKIVLFDNIVDGGITNAFPTNLINEMDADITKTFALAISENIKENCSIKSPFDYLYALATRLLQREWKVPSFRNIRGISIKIPGDQNLITRSDILFRNKEATTQDISNIFNIGVNSINIKN